MIHFAFRKLYFALKAIFDEHESDILFFDGSDDGVFVVVSVFEVVVGVVVA